MNRLDYWPDDCFLTYCESQDFLAKNDLQVVVMSGSDINRLLQIAELSQRVDETSLVIGPEGFEIASVCAKARWVKKQRSMVAVA